jgi:pteridine reductase
MLDTVLVTGSAKRGGAAIARAIHSRGFRVIVHSRKSSELEATELMHSLNMERAHSAFLWIENLSEQILSMPDFSHLVGVVANASEYRHSDLNSDNGVMLEDLRTHLLGHLEIIKCCQAELTKNNGSIVAICDIHTERPNKNYLSYNISKGALQAAVRALAAELSPQVRVNAVSPGALEWPINHTIEWSRQQEILNSIPLGRVGKFEELAKAVCFLLFDATYTTGSTLYVDGGRSSFLA